MSRPGEDRITDMIKSKLDGFEPAYNPEAWNKLNTRLNQNATPTVVPYKPWLLGFVAGILLSVGVFYYLQTGGEKDNITTGNDWVVELQQLKQEVEKLKRHNKLESYSSINNRKNVGSLHNSNAGGKNIYQPIVDTKYVFIQPESRYNNKLNSNGNAPLQKIIPVSSAFQTQYILLNDSLPYANSGINEEKKRKRRKNTFKLSLPKLDLKQDNLGKFTGPDRIYLGGSFSAERNIDGINTLSKSIGIGLSGKITNSISFTGGVDYGTNAGEKGKKLWYFERVVKPDTSYYQKRSDTTLVNRFNWNYIDIPLGFRYQLMSNSEQALGLSISTVSRIYLSEKYTNLLVIRDKEGDKSTVDFKAGEHVHLFSKLRLGLSYTRNLSDRWSVEAQPYYSIPLGKHSYLKTKNSSFGLNLNMVYKLNKHKY